MSKLGVDLTPLTRMDIIKRASETIENLAKKIESQIDPRIDETELPNKPWPHNLGEFQDGYEEIVEPFDESTKDIDIDKDPYGSAIGCIAEEGIEAIAFYKSFRFKNYQPAKGLWGIFYIKPRFKALQTEMCLDLNIKSSEAYIKLHEFLYGHEIYHYKVDAVCLQHEAFMNKFLYRPYRQFVSNLSISDWWEEAVANHYALTKNDGIFTQFFTQLILSSPGAYAKGIYKDDAWRSINPRSYLADQIEQCIRPSSILTNEILFDELKLSGHKNPRMIFSKLRNDSYLTRTLAIKNCPQYWISWARSGNIVSNLLAPDLREIENEYVGKYLNGQKLKTSDHAYFKIDNGEKVKMPNPHSKTIKPYEFKNIVSKAGMTIVDFWNERQKTKKWKKNCPRMLPLDPIVSKK